MTYLSQSITCPLGAVPGTVGSAAKVFLGVRGDSERLLRAFDRSAVPMVMVDGRRRHTAVNRSARLVLRLSLRELLGYRIDDLTPRDGLPSMQAAWARLLEAGCVVGRHEVAGRDGTRLEVVYWALSNALPGLHLIAFAPARWPENELELRGDGEQRESVPSLTPREREVLQLAADGLTGPGIAEALVIGHATVRTHFRHIYEKLGVGDRSAAVANALRQGMIE